MRAVFHHQQKSEVKIRNRDQKGKSKTNGKFADYFTACFQLLRFVAQAIASGILGTKVGKKQPM